MVGVVTGAGLVILQLKYGSGPVIAAESPEAAQQSCLEEPKALEGGDEPAEEDPAEQPESAPSQTQRELMTDLLQYVHKSAEQPEAARADSSPEQLPMPTERPVVRQRPDCVRDPFGSPPPEPVHAPAPIVVTAPERHPKELKHIKAPPQVPFVGTYDCTLNDHGETTLPAEVHEAMGSRRPRILYLAPCGERGLWVYTAAGLARLVEQNNGAVAGEKEDREKRLWFSRVTQVDVAADGTFRLPEDIIQFAGLKAELVLVGVNDHYEIWDVDRWDDYCEPAETGLSLNEIVGVMKNVAKHLVGGFRSTTDNASTFNPVFCLQELLQAEVKCEVDVDEDNARCTEP
jgi:MraZ protein